MRRVFFLPLLLCAGAALGQTPAALKRGDIEPLVRVSGTIIAEDVFRLKATIDGRIALASVSSGTWYDSGQLLGLLADEELAAILDAHASTAHEILEERWQRMYKPTKIACPTECFVLKSYIRARQSVKSRAILLEAAKRLVLSGHVASEDAHLVKFGQAFDFWPAGEPGKKMSVTITRYEISERDPNREPGGHVTRELSRAMYLNPGTNWEGVIHAGVKKNALLVPTAALIEHQGHFYLPVEVSTGLATTEATEITSGAEEGRRVLVIEESKLGSAARMKFEPKKEAPPKVPPPIEAAPEPPAQAPSRAVRKEESIPEPDPYEE